MSYMTLSSQEKHLFLLCSYFHAHPTTLLLKILGGTNAWASPPQILGGPSPESPLGLRLWICRDLVGAGFQAAKPTPPKQSGQKDRPTLFDDGCARALIRNTTIRHCSRTMPSIHIGAAELAANRKCTKYNTLAQA